jgi:hypothetical protein
VEISSLVKLAGHGKYLPHPDPSPKVERGGGVRHACGVLCRTNLKTGEISIDLYNVKAESDLFVP